MRRIFLFRLGILLLFAYLLVFVLAFYIQTKTEKENGVETISLKIDDIIRQLDKIENSNVEVSLASLSDSFRIGLDGQIMLIQDKQIISTTHPEWLGKTVDTIEGMDDVRINQPFTFLMDDEKMLCLFRENDGIIVAAMLPESEVYDTRNETAVVILLTDFLLVALIFIFISSMVQRLVIGNIYRVNEALTKITKGDLTQVVAVNDSEEFRTLSNGINQTVSALKDLLVAEASRIDEELLLAAEIQRSALPNIFPPYPQNNEFDVYAMIDPAKEVGGDFYDFFLLPDNQFCFVIADVSDKGIPAALFMMTAKTTIKALAESGADPGEILFQANNRLRESNRALMFVTALVCKLDLQSGKITYASAGHNPPLLLRNKNVDYIRKRTGFVLALKESVRYENHVENLGPGDSFLIYTDGVTDAKNAQGDFFGEQRLLEVVADVVEETPEGLLSEIKTSLDEFSFQTAQADDITMLCVQFHGEGEAYERNDHKSNR
ncbi:MAG: SpoIIE family protein phosphatase [Eubacteriaceae bacterium]